MRIAPARPALLWLVAFAACGLSPLGLRAGDAAQRTVKLAGFTIAIERTVTGDAMMGEDLLTIRKGGRLYHAETGAHIQFSTPKEPLADLPALVAVTGKAALDIVVQSYSGGAHCCFTVTVVTLAEPFAATDGLDTQSAGAKLFKLPDGGGYGLQTAESAFDYWRTSYVDSPEPTLYLRYDADAYGYKFVPSLMRKPAPTVEALTKLGRQFHDDAEAWKVGPDLVNPAYLRAVVELIYQGNLESAHKLAAAGWPDGRPGREGFTDDLFSCVLPSSQWWPEVAALNGIEPYEQASDCK